MKLLPIIIRYIEILENNIISENTANIGLFKVIIKIADTIDKMNNISNTSILIQ
jgi:hypothetical protein